jgi:lipoprotein-anchoring transpeptidase ErfK/SrfK
LASDGEAVAKLEAMHRRLLIGLPLAALLAGCGASTQPAASGAQHTRRAQHATQPKAKHCRAGVAQPLGSSRVAYAAIVRRNARAVRRPGGPVFARFGRLNQNGFPTTFGVRAVIRARDCRPLWYRVQLPMRPNGVTGYVRAAQVGVDPVRTRILVDISARRLTFLRKGRVVLRTTVAVGSSATPTPTGSYYVNQRLIPADTSGPFGPGALGISAFSNVLTGWTQGGPVAIHGTNEPSSIGHAVSNGCIRVVNRTLSRLFAAAPAGTPVLIRA